jgi:hypothetical protein
MITSQNTILYSHHPKAAATANKAPSISRWIMVMKASIGPPPVSDFIAPVFAAEWL